MDRIYLDHAATTPVRPEVAAAMALYLDETDGFGNPSSIHSFGQRAKAALDDARDTLAVALEATPSEIVFTSGGTEADNLALIGIMTAARSAGNHLITSKIEHEAVLRTAEFLETIGIRATYLDVDRYGRADPADVEAAIEPDTVLVSIMHANNEVGTIQPIKEIAEIVHKRGVFLHVDAVQSFGQLPVGAECLGADAISISGHKIYGPKGVGALFVRRGISINPQLHGGGQERSRRSGTENVAGIVGLAEATRRLVVEREANADRMCALRDQFIREAAAAIPGLSVNGHPTQRLPNNISISVPGVEGEAMLLNLDLAGIAVSSGSACASGSIEPSHVLQAMNLPAELLRSALRITIGRGTTPAEMQRALTVLTETTKRLAAMSRRSLSAI